MRKFPWPYAMPALMLAVIIAAMTGCDTAPGSDPTGDLCGGIAGVLCPEGFYCEFEDGTCAVADRAGTCQPVPELCTLEFAPVCGCDGNTYGNACLAAAEGVSIDTNSACP